MLTVLVDKGFLLWIQGVSILKPLRYMVYSKVEVSASFVRSHMDNGSDDYVRLIFCAGRYVLTGEF